MAGSASLLPSGVVLVIIAILRLLKDIVSDEKNLYVAAIMQRFFVSTAPATLPLSEAPANQDVLWQQ